jgi:hypothetical protein
MLTPQSMPKEKNPHNADTIYISDPSKLATDSIAWCWCCACYLSRTNFVASPGPSHWTIIPADVA